MFQPRSPFPIVCAALILFSFCSVPSSGQATGGTISGTVRNASGDPMPGATITIINQDTGVTRVVRSGTGGAYSATGLAPGLYALSADLPGVGKATQRNRRLAPDAALTVDLSLELAVSEEVTVTAMKREETVHETPFSVAATTEEVLRERGVENLEEAAANVASFSVQNLGPGQSQIAIRGVSSGQIARDQPGVKESVGVYLDESVISLSLFMPDLDLFDMSRLEVLRGSQGTLFGSGSLGGTVRYITNQPELGATRFFGELSGDTLSDGNQGGSVKAGVNTALGDRAALRIAGYYDRLAGWMDAVQPDLSVKKNVNTGDRTGVRASVLITPSDRLSIVPRFVYQKVEMDGWNRIDVFNILANPYTTTRPAVTLGDRKLFTQIKEPFTDKFVLGDLNVRYDFGGVALTSITSYTHRDIDVLRDATALTASITGGSIGLPENVYTLDAPLDDATKAKGWTEELRLSGGSDRFRWLAGGFYADSKRDYGQNLLVAGFEELTGIPTRGLRAPKNSLFFSDLSYDLKQYAVFGEGTLKATDRLSLTGGLRYYHFKEDKEQIFDGIFAQDNTGTALVSQPGSTNANGVAPRFIATYKVSDATNLNAQIAKGFRLGGINDPLNVPLCTAQDLVTFGGRESWNDETAWNYEVGSKSRLFNGRGDFNISAFYVDIKDLQVSVTAGSCSSRLVFNVPKARSVGGEIEFALAPSDRFDFALSAGYNDSELRSTLTSTDAMGNVSVVSGIEEGRRLPSVPKFQAAVAATYRQPISPGFQGYLTGTYNHVGSRFTQVGDEDLGVVNLLSFEHNPPGSPPEDHTHTIGGPLTQTTFTFDPELPAYDIINLRLGVKHANWDVSLFANNVTDERAFLALDRERGLRARVGYLTNQPRTIGITTRLDF